MRSFFYFSSPCRIFVEKTLLLTTAAAAARISLMLSASGGFSGRDEAKILKKCTVITLVTRSSELCIRQLHMCSHRARPF